MGISRLVVLSLLILFNLAIFGSTEIDSPSTIEGINLFKGEHHYAGVVLKGTSFNLTMTKKNEDREWRISRSSRRNNLAIGHPTSTDFLSTFPITATKAGKAVLKIKYIRHYKKLLKLLTHEYKDKEKTIELTVVDKWADGLSLLQPTSELVVANGDLALAQDYYSIVHGVHSKLRVLLPSYSTPWTVEPRTFVVGSGTVPAGPNQVADYFDLDIGVAGVEVFTFEWNYEPIHSDSHPQRGKVDVDQIRKTLKINAVRNLGNSK